MPETHMSRQQKSQFIEDGFIVIENAINQDVLGHARDLLLEQPLIKDRELLVTPELTTHPSILALFNDSVLADIIRNEMGPYPEVISCQIAVTPPFDTLGGEPGPHVDGSWSGPIPDSMFEIDPITTRPKNAAKYFGVNDEVRGTNDGQLWLDPERRLSIGSYTTLVGVALNDQLLPGNGQLAVMRGCHEAVEEAFKKQRDSRGVIGPEGLDWPRIKESKNGKPFYNGLPDAVRQKANEMASEKEPTENWPWPELTPVLMNAGDAVIAMHSCPHTPTPNFGPNPRMNIYFRIRRLREDNPHEGSRRLGHGVSDHLDRGYFGQFLEYPESYNPWQTSIDKLCDHWSEWDGFQELINAERERSTAT